MGEEGILPPCGVSLIVRCVQGGGGDDNNKQVRQTTETHLYKKINQTISLLPPTAAGK